MREEVLFVGGSATAAAIAFLVLRARLLTMRVRERLETQSFVSGRAGSAASSGSLAGARAISRGARTRKRGRGVAIGAAVVVFAIITGWLGIAFGVWPIALAIALVAAIATYFVADTQSMRADLALEEQLADAIDLIVSALRAGVSLMDSIDAAASEASGRLRDVLTETSGRLKLGDRPTAVFADLGTTIPLESFRMLGFILAVQWQAGGSLAGTLAAVGRSIRDRLDIVRRVRAQAAEAQFSVIGILGIVYLVAVLLWRSDPARMQEFLGWTPGVALTIAAILAQSIGLLWMRRLSSIPL